MHTASAVPCIFITFLLFVRQKFSFCGKAENPDLLSVYYNLHSSTTCFSFCSHFIYTSLWISLYFFTNFFIRSCVQTDRERSDLGQSLQLLVFNNLFIVRYTNVLSKPKNFNCLEFLPAENARSKSCLAIVLLTSIF